MVVAGEVVDLGGGLDQVGCGLGEVEARVSTSANASGVLVIWTASSTSPVSAVTHDHTTFPVEIDSDVLLTDVAFHLGPPSSIDVEHLQHQAEGHAERGPNLSSFIASGMIRIGRPAGEAPVAAGDRGLAGMLGARGGQNDRTP